MIAILYIACAQSFAKAADLATLQRDFNATLSAIQSWSGSVKVETKGGESPYIATGIFAWDANQGRFRCSIEHPTRINLLDQEKSIVASNEVKRLREVIVKDGSRTEI